MTSWRDFKKSRVKVGGVDLTYWRAGRGAPVLLLHGWMGKAYSWRKLAPLLAEHATVVVPDLRGYGESDKPASGYDGRILKDDVRGLISALKLEKPFVVGHDMGALPAFLYAAEHPDEVSALAYLDEPLPGYNLDGYTTFGPPIGGFWWFGFHWTPGLSELLLKGKEREFVEFIMTAMVADKRCLTAKDFDEYARTYRGAYNIAGTVGWYRAVMETGEQIKAAGRLPASLPLLALGGEYGIAGTFEQMKLVHDAPEGGVIPGCGHLLAEEKPEELAERPLAFMRRHGLVRDAAFA